jgi:SAM-dependent methyltransferase
MWGSAPFEQVAVTLAGMHDTLIDHVEAGPGDVWLDVACGTGELAFRAVGSGASVGGCDLAPALVETARRQAAERGLSIPFEVADCENLPYADGSYDVVTSSVGAIFAPDHGQMASELARICRPGGRLAMSAWTTEGRIGAFFRLIASYSPPPVEGAGSPVAWGDAAYCESRLGDRFRLSFEELDVPWEADSADAMWDELSVAFGPIATLLRTLEPDRARAFRDDMVAWFAEGDTGDGVVLERPYLLISGERR